MDAASWHYIGEGGKHALFGYHQRPSSSPPAGVVDDKHHEFLGRLLRINKKDIALSSKVIDKNETIDEARASTISAHNKEDPLWFLRQIVKPHLEQYLDLPEKIQLPWSFLSELKEKTLNANPCPIPESRRQTWIATRQNIHIDNIPPFASGWLVWDYRRITKKSLSNNTTQNDVGPPCISVEIKPKAGYRASSPLVHPLRSLKFLKSRFVLLQELDRLGKQPIIPRGWRESSAISKDDDTIDSKKQDTETPKTMDSKKQETESSKMISDYDPLDLFFLETERIQQSLASLWACPQNNFKLWYMPSLKASKAASHNEHPALLIADDHYRNADVDHSLLPWQTILHNFFFAPETGLPTCNNFDEPEVSKEILLTVLSKVLQAEKDVFRKILQWQQLDVLDGDGAVIVYQRLVELCQGSHEEAQLLLDKRFEEVPASMNSNDSGGFLDTSPYNPPTSEASCPAFTALCSEVDRFSGSLNRFLDEEKRMEFVRNEHEESRQACLHHLSQIQSKQACCYLLQNWLLSLAMCDISFFVTLQQVHTQNSTTCSETKSDLLTVTASSIRRQTSDHPGLVQVRLCPNQSPVTFQYELKLIDCDQKPAKKLQSREKKEKVFEYLSPETYSAPVVGRGNLSGAT